MRSYELQFLPIAKAEWDTLDGSVRQQFAKVLLKRLDNPKVPAAALSSMPDCYKIKLRTAGYRLVYRAQDGALVLLTIAIGKRDKNAVYEVAKIRLRTVSDKVTKTKAKTIRKRPKGVGSK
jgi:mRNA interferase RelE/StbE